MVSPLLDQVLCQQHVPRQPRDSLFEFPDWGGVQGAVLFVYVFLDELFEWLVDAVDRRGVCAPGVDGKAVLFEKEVLEASHVWCGWANVGHSLEPDILVEPD